MPLNDLQIKRIKPTDKKQTLSDGGGLALVVNAVSRGGTKYFVYNYRFDGKQQSLRIGKYPDIGLAEAREQHQQARNNLAKGINPSQAKQTGQARAASRPIKYLCSGHEAMAHQEPAPLEREIRRPHHAVF